MDEEEEKKKRLNQFNSHPHHTLNTYISLIIHSQNTFLKSTLRICGVVGWLYTLNENILFKSNKILHFAINSDLFRDIKYFQC